MLKQLLSVSLLVGLGVSPLVAGRCQSTVLPPVRSLGPRVAEAVDSISFTFTVRGLGDGRVLLNDIGGRHVLLLSADLQRSTMVIGAVGANARAYPASAGGLIPAPGDSTIFVDGTARAFILLDPNGRIVRISAMPPAAIFPYGPATVGGAAEDARGRIVFIPQVAFQIAAPNEVDTVIRRESPIVRVDPLARTEDTVAVYSRPTQRFAATRNSIGQSVTTQVIDPVQTGDTYAIAYDGTVAVVRGDDYHVDWIAPDGVQRSTHPVAHRWIRLTDSAKTALVDSTRAYWQAHPIDTPTRAGSGGPVVHVSYVYNVVDPTAVADYPAPFRIDPAIADYEGNVWVAEMTPKSEPPVYDVIDRRGVLIDRVSIPGGTTIMGFVPGRILLASDLGNLRSLVEYRVR